MFSGTASTMYCLRRIRVCRNVNNFSSISTPTNNNMTNINHERMSGLKRFYKHVDVAEAVNKPGYYNVLLDNKVLKSPARGDFELPNRNIATIIAAEWDAQINKNTGIQPTSMPFMILASTAVDQIIPDSAFVKQTCLSYLPTDTSLFLNDESDRILLSKQKAAFVPLVAWFNSEFKVDIKFSHNSIQKINHSEDTLLKIRQLLDSMDPFTLACTQCLTMECKSLIIALGLLYRYIV